MSRWKVDIDWKDKQNFQHLRRREDLKKIMRDKRYLLWWLIFIFFSNERQDIFHRFTYMSLDIYVFRPSIIDFLLRLPCRVPTGVIKKCGWIYFFVHFQIQLFISILWVFNIENPSIDTKVMNNYIYYFKSSQNTCSNT